VIDIVVAIDKTSSSFGGLALNNLLLKCGRVTYTYMLIIYPKLSGDRRVLFQI